MALPVMVAVVLSVTGWGVTSAVAVALTAPVSLWIAGGAATCLLGLASPGQPTRPAALAAGWRPHGRTSVVVTLCGEPPEPVARRLAALRTSLDRTGWGDRVVLHVLSDTGAEGTGRADRSPGRCAAAREARAFTRLIAAGAVQYRRRGRNTGRKPGNIADWLAAQGDAADYMLVLDADSRLSADRIGRLVRQMDDEPGLALIQAGMRLAPGATVFAGWQRNAARLIGPAFVRGFAAWTGGCGNYWGHNALIRVAAFRAEAAPLPVLSGRAPFGGPILSHDFVEAALLTRAGWGVRIDADLGGSAEEAPETLGAFHRRDRRWCQGNLQHLRLVGWPGLRGLSRLHLAAGIFSYAVAPLWLILVLLSATGAVGWSSAAPALCILALLLVPKLAGLAFWWRKARTTARRAVVLRAALGEAALSALIAPLIMVRQSISVAAVCIGRDCGWRPGLAPRREAVAGLPEAAAGVALAALTLAFTGPAGTLWLLPVLGPLLSAPLLVPALERARCG